MAFLGWKLFEKRKKGKGKDDGFGAGLLDLDEIHNTGHVHGGGEGGGGGGDIEEIDGELSVNRTNGRVTNPVSSRFSRFDDEVRLEN